MFLNVRGRSHFRTYRKIIEEPIFECVRRSRTHSKIELLRISFVLFALDRVTCHYVVWQAWITIVGFAGNSEYFHEPSVRNLLKNLSEFLDGCQL
jgi:hypothetical protein